MKPALRRRLLPLTLLAASLFSAASHADSLPCDASMFGGAPLQSLLKGSSNTGPNVHNTQLVWGSSFNVSSITTSSGGTLNIRLQDIGFPEALDSLKVLVTDLDGMWRQFDATASGGSLLTNIGVSGPSQLFAVVFAQSQQGSYGLYDFRTSFAPVPLPAAVWLLISGLAGLGALRRRRPGQ